MKLFALASSGPRSAASFFLGALALTSCERGKSPPNGGKAEAAFADSVIGPDSSAEALLEYARTHLPTGVKLGDFLTTKSDYPTGDTADVFRAALDSLYSTPSGGPAVVVLSDATIAAASCMNVPCAVVNARTTKISRSTFDAFKLALLTRRHIKPDFSYRIPIKLISEEDSHRMLFDSAAVRRALAAGARPDNEFWLSFIDYYPGAWGYAQLSQVGMNPQRDEALLQVRHNCGTDCHSIETMLVRKAGGHWQVVERMSERADSSDNAQRFLRYRGPGAGISRGERRTAAVAESLRIDAIHRDIHGVLRDMDGVPIAGASLSLTQNILDDPARLWKKVYSDSTGAYRFDQPPVDRVAITVRCPASTRRPNGPLAITSVDTKPATAIPFDMKIDRRTCDDEFGTIQSIQGPFEAPPLGHPLDSTHFRYATYPAGEEAAVYRAALAQLEPHADEVALVYYKTRTLCGGAACAAKYNDRIRYVPEVMLSAMTDFLSVREAQRDLKADFLPGKGYVMFGDSALYAFEQAMRQGNLIDNWSIFHLAHPEVHSVISLGRVGFSPRKRQALVEMIYNDGGGLRDELWVLQRSSAGEWQNVTHVNIR